MRFVVKTSFVVASIIAFSLAAAWAGELQKGEEIAGEVFVSWKAVVQKVSTGHSEQTKVKAQVDFAGQTIWGRRIRGSGKMRFVGPGSSHFRSGDVLQGESVLRYRATVSSLLGEDLIMMKGVGMFDFSKQERVHFSPAVIELKAAMDTDRK